MRLSRRIYLLLIVSAITASISVIVFASVSQFFPSVTVPPVTFALTQNCTNLTFQSTVSALTGILLADCQSGSSSLPAFSVNRDGSSTPTFTINTSGGILTIALGIVVDGTGCGSSISALTSGASHSFSGRGDYDYCLSYTATSAGGTINSFTITWS